MLQMRRKWYFRVIQALDEKKYYSFEFHVPQTRKNSTYRPIYAFITRRKQWICKYFSENVNFLRSNKLQNEVYNNFLCTKFIYSNFRWWLSRFPLSPFSWCWTNPRASFRRNILFSHIIKANIIFIKPFFWRWHLT